MAVQYLTMTSKLHDETYCHKICKQQRSFYVRLIIMNELYFSLVC